MELQPESQIYSQPIGNTTITSPVPPTGNGSSVSSGSAKRRRTSTTGSRGVANLTPEQLAKKRANDREAQRAIRERTKTQIESLERKIQELTSQQPYQELQQVIRQKELVEAENDDIKKRLASVYTIVQPFGAVHGLPDLVQSFYGDLNGAQPPFSPRRDGSVQSNPLIPGPTSLYGDASSLRSGTSPSTFASSPQAPRLTPPIQPLAMCPSQVIPFSPINVYDRQRNNISHGLELPASGERLNLGFLLDHRSQGADGGQQIENGRGVPSLLPYTSLSDAPPPIKLMQNLKRNDIFEAPLLAHTAPVRNIGPTCPLDGLLLNFLAERQQRAAEGVSNQKLVGPAYPSVSSLLNPERSIYSHPLSKFFTDILSTFPDLSALPEQVAVLYIMFLIMRWQISPTQETYDRLPEWVTPRPSQLFTPHPAWVDHLPWPRMRDRMVELYPSIPLENFFIPYTTTLSLNWPYDPSDTLLSLSDSDELSINPVFERHLRDLSNWTLGPAFAKAFPTLAETTKIKPDPNSRPNV